MGNADSRGAGTVGVPVIPGSVRLDQVTGEICVRHRCLMMGFMHDPEKTRQTIDGDGWLHTGDIGKVDAHGSYMITGRIKELIITAGGENIPPVPICVQRHIRSGNGEDVPYYASWQSVFGTNDRKEVEIRCNEQHM